MKAGERRPILINAADIKPLTPEQRAANESAYRRGYCQGYAQAVDALSKEARLPRRIVLAFDKFIFDVLYKWRGARRNGELEAPPAYKNQPSE